jgi:hypothetical protein
MNTNMNIEQMINFLKTANEEQRNQLAMKMSYMNAHNRNMKKTENFAEKIIEKKNEKKDVFMKFLDSKSINGVIYAPTQVGKSAATRAFIETCFKYNTPVIVSTDNKTDQQEQLYYRIEKDLAGADVTMLKVCDKSFKDNLKKCIKMKNKRFVIFCLDNACQIEKVIEQLSSNYMRYSEMKEIKRLAIIHDEADTVAKDRDTENQDDNQAESHKKWLELKDLINKNMGGIDLKRIFVTATPENCVMLYKIECPDVMRLEIPSCYTGYKNIEHKVLEDDIKIKKLLKKEVNRINEEETYEAILYCIDRKIVDGHERVLKTLATDLKCIVNTYNGNGITTFIRTVTLRKKLEKELNKNEISFTKKDNYYQIKNMTIRKFYTIVKKIGERCVITIGKDLICRGISYVGENQNQPITATTMFYKPGSTMHAVGICQTIGRITGCAMPDLPRRLYAPKDVYDTYLRYNQNQELFITKIGKGGEDTITKDIIEELVFNKYTRNVDRMKLNLRMNMKTPSECSDTEYGSSEEEEEEEEEEEDKMQRLINMWWGKRTIIGKILTFIYDNENGTSEKELKEYMNKCGSKNIDRMYKELLRKDKNFISVFERKNNITNLTKEAREYIYEL